MNTKTKTVINQIYKINKLITQLISFITQMQSTVFGITPSDSIKILDSFNKAKPIVIDDMSFCIIDAYNTEIVYSSLPTKGKEIIDSLYMFDTKDFNTYWNLELSIFDLPFEQILVPLEDIRIFDMEVKGVLISQDHIVYIGMSYGKPDCLIVRNNGKWTIGTEGRVFASHISMVFEVLEIICAYKIKKIDRQIDPDGFRKLGILSTKKGTPKEYYTVDMSYETVVVKEQNVSVAKSGTLELRSKSECQYSYDVRGHWSYRILKGYDELDESTWKYLKENTDRTVYTDMSTISAEHRQILEDRKIDITGLKWLSILKYWTRPHRANIDKPYIPSIGVKQ